MTMNRGYKAALGLALLVGAGVVGTAGAQGMMGGGQGAQGMQGGGMGMMQACPMMGGMMSGGGMDMMGGMMSGGGMGMMGDLGLNEDQQAQLRERRSEHRHEQFSRMAKMMDLREEMQALMAAERPDPESVQELHGRMADLHGNMMADRIRLRNDMLDMLTDEQREQMHERMGGPRGAMGNEQGRDDDHEQHHGDD